MTSEARREPGDDDESFATAQEIRDAVESLQHPDYQKLMLIACSFARTRLRGTGVEPEDLIHDAIAKTLEGRRRWNRSVSILKHLDRVMESDAGHEAARRAAQDFRRLVKPDAEPSARQPRPEARLVALDEFDGLLALFVDDEAALGLLRLKARGFAASEIQRELGIQKTQYDTILKRIRRRVIKHVAEGGI
jgi:RNA polymerase sigma-70 factor (ECF subfamily)